MIRETAEYMHSTEPEIPLSRPFMGEEEARAAADVVRSGVLSQGPHVAEFERVVAERVGVTHAVAVNSCTAALHLALICMGIRTGDEVILPSFTFVATANAVVHAGARPVFVDIDARTYNINPLLIEESLTNRTKAILAVDQLGLPAALAPIQGIATRHNLKTLEDAACALGADYRGKPIGAVSPITCFSFHSGATVTAGEGGMLLTNDDRIAERSRSLRSQGASTSDFTRHHGGVESYNELGFNYRMTEMQAAIGVEQMKKLDTMLARRRRLADRYDDQLADFPGVQIPYGPQHTPHTYQSYCIRLDPAQTPPRDWVIARLQEQGIATRRGVMAIHEEPYYAIRFGRISLPITEATTRETLLLPLYADMTDAEQDRVIGALTSALREGPRQVNPFGQSRPFAQRGFRR